jgi:hypothetical protein
MHDKLWQSCGLDKENIMGITSGAFTALGKKTGGSGPAELN